MSIKINPKLALGFLKILNTNKGALSTLWELSYPRGNLKNFVPLFFFSLLVSASELFRVGSLGFLKTEFSKLVSDHIKFIETPLGFVWSVNESKELRVSVSLTP